MSDVTPLIACTLVFGLTIRMMVSTMILPSFYLVLALVLGFMAGTVCL